MTDDFLERFEARRRARIEAERSFTLAGVTLTYRAGIPPEVALRLEDLRVAYVGQDANTNGARISAIDLVQAADESILSCLEPESREAWAQLRDPEAEYPLTIEDIFELADYLIGRSAGVPTDAPADSSDGRTPTGNGSKADSSSKATASIP